MFFPNGGSVFNLLRKSQQPGAINQQKSNNYQEELQIEGRTPGVEIRQSDEVAAKKPGKQTDKMTAKVGTYTFRAEES